MEEAESEYSDKFEEVEAAPEEQVESVEEAEPEHEELESPVEQDDHMAQVVSGEAEPLQSEAAELPLEEAMIEQTEDVMDVLQGLFVTSYYW